MARTRMGHDHGLGTAQRAFENETYGSVHSDRVGLDRQDITDG
jgi:hypothetical protein